MAQRFRCQPDESDRNAYERLYAEYVVIWAAYSEIKATVDRAAQVKARALQAEYDLTKLLAGWCATGFPQAVQEEQRNPGCNMKQWGIAEWSGFFYTIFNRLVTAVQSGTIYVACPRDRPLADVQVEISKWIQEATREGSLAKGRQVILMGTVVTKPGSGWRRIGLREVRR